MLIEPNLLNYILFIGITLPAVENIQSNTSFPFGWDDVDQEKLLEDVCIASYNQVCQHMVHEHAVSLFPIVSMEGAIARRFCYAN